MLIDSMIRRSHSQQTRLAARAPVRLLLLGLVLCLTAGLGYLGYRGTHAGGAYGVVQGYVYGPSGYGLAGATVRITPQYGYDGCPSGGEATAEADYGGSYILENCIVTATYSVSGVSAPGYHLAANSPATIGTTFTLTDVSPHITLNFSMVDDNTDTDGDGVPDIQDNCPNQKGSTANHGCPVATPAPTKTTPTSPSSPSSPPAMGSSGSSGSTAKPPISSSPSASGSAGSATRSSGGQSIAAVTPVVNPDGTVSYPDQTYTPNGEEGGSDAQTPTKPPSGLARALGISWLGISLWIWIAGGLGLLVLVIAGIWGWRRRGLSPATAPGPTIPVLPVAASSGAHSHVAGGERAGIANFYPLEPVEPIAPLAPPTADSVDQDLVVAPFDPKKPGTPPAANPTDHPRKER
jgi:hypothetical protein